MGLGFVCRTRQTLSSWALLLLSCASLASCDRAGGWALLRTGGVPSGTSSYVPSLGALEAEAWVSCAPRSEVSTAKCSSWQHLLFIWSRLSGGGRGKGPEAEVAGGKERIKCLIHVSQVKGRGTWEQG